MNGFLQRIIEMANANHDRMNGTIEPVLDIINSNDLVLAVWQDQRQPHGVDFLVLKGMTLLRQFVDGGQAIPARTSAVKCVDADQAHAVSRAFRSWLPSSPTAR